ncbi:MAG: ammonia-forming cytochrome c nitrite reductase subunit c552 [Chloroflexi bacterium]|nr:ammonia-forming cytochrome c nitrite reductase subunit c552 [Chloroflexota bacterium]
MARTRRLLVIFGAALIATVLVVLLLITIVERQQEARLTYFKVAEIPPGEPNPEVWGRNFPHQYDSWQNTMRTTTFSQYSKYGRYGGSEAFQRLEKYPDYRRLFAGYPFSVDYREDRGHALALEDMLATQRLGDRKPGSCMTCKSSQVPGLIRQLGADQFYATPVKQLVDQHGVKYSISCADCHNAETMALTITRPAFREAMASRGIDVSKASQQEMRTYVCAQCHVEYYFRPPNNTVVFPWRYGLTIEDIERYYQEIQFSDWTHGETRAAMVKMQHPEFELYSTGVHARAGVACADCHMPYTRVGAAKISSHWVNTPLAHVNTSCLTCHRQSEEEMRQRVLTIQDRTYGQMKHAETALIAAMDTITTAMRAGVTDDKLAEARALHRRAQMRWDFISAENSMGFHSPQEAVRILGDATDLARQAQLAAYQAMIPPQPRSSNRQ